MIKFNHLIFFLHRRCLVGCKSCNVNATPLHERGLSPQWLKQFFSRVDNLPFSRYIIWTGGEPFLSFSSLKIGIGLASTKGFNSEILTSGDWYKSGGGELKQLVAAGSFSLRISIDAEHQQKVALPVLVALIKEALEFGIEVNFTLREIPDSSSTVVGYLEEIRRYLPQFYHENINRSRWLHRIPHIPRTDRVFPGFDCSIPRVPDGTLLQPCKMGFKDLVVGEDGMIYPCCGIFGFANHSLFACGDPLKNSWDEISGKQRRHPLFAMLQQKGPSGILQHLGLVTDDESAIAARMNPCQCCGFLFHFFGEKVFSHYTNY